MSSCATRSEEHTSGLTPHRYLHSFPTRRSSDLIQDATSLQGHRLKRSLPAGTALTVDMLVPDVVVRNEIGRAHVWTHATPISTLFPYTTLFRSHSGRYEPAGASAQAIAARGHGFDGRHARSGSRRPQRDRKSTRLDSRHTDIYTLSLHDALPISFRTLRACRGIGSSDRCPRARL